MRVVMTAMSDIVRDARIQREARTLQAAGHEVVVFGLRPSDADEMTLPDDLDIRWIGGTSPFPRGRRPRRLRKLFRSMRWLLLPRHIRALEASFHEGVLGASDGQPIDVVHAHDFDTLPLGAAIAERAGAKLVYDSHEAWLARRRPGRPTPLVDRRTARLERALGEQADAVITVSPSLGRWLEAKYGWDSVLIVRNTFPLGAEPLPEPPTTPSDLVYAGRIGRGRDLETLAAAAPRLRGLRTVLIGPIDQTFPLPRSSLTVMPPVSVDAVDDVLRSGGLALVAMAEGPLNHKVALPNKLFQAVRAGVPVVAVDLPELRRVVTDHGIGTLYRPGDPEDLVRATMEAVERYDELTSAVRVARRGLSWDVDGAILVDLYQRLR